MIIVPITILSYVNMVENIHDLYILVINYHHRFIDIIHIIINIRFVAKKKHYYSH